MITQVRIAPPEHWCPERAHARLNTLVGRPIQIIPSTMRINATEPICGGREWQIPQALAIQMGDEIGYDYRSCSAVWICEHLLEMD